VQSKTLIAETKIGVAASENLVGEQETPSAETIVDGDANERTVDLNAVLYDETEIVTTIDTTTCRSMLGWMLWISRYLLTHKVATTMNPDSHWKRLPVG